MDRLLWVKSFEKLLQAQLTKYLEEQTKIQAENPAVIAQQRAQEEKTRQSEIADFKVKLLHQENFAHKVIAHDLYFTWSDSELKSRFGARAAALKKMFQTTDSFLSKKSYTVLKSVQNIITQYDKHADYATLQGSQLQHVLHQELLDLYEQSSQLPSSDAFYKEQIAYTGALAREANENGLVLLASQILDYGWTLLECGKSLALGVKDGVVNLVNPAIHPIDTLTDMAHGVLQVAQLSVAGIKEAGCFAYDAVVNKEQMYARLNNYCNTTQQFCDGISEIPTQELIRKTTAFLTEAIIVHRAFKALPQVKQLAKQSSQNAVNYIQKTRQIIEQSRTAAVTAEGIKLPAAPYLEQMASEVKLSAEKVHKTSALKAATKFIPLAQELPLLRERFNGILEGWNELAGKKITFYLRHIFEDKLILDNGNFNGFSGFHHDPCLIIKTAGKSQGVSFKILQEITGPAGSYKLIFQGTNKLIPKSFFPYNWSRTYVMEKIVEGCKNAERAKAPVKLAENGKYVTFGITNEGMEIRIIFDSVGNIISAYPEIN